MFDYQKTMIPLPHKIEDGGKTLKLSDFGGSICLEAIGEDDRIKEAVKLIAKRLSDLAMVTIDGDADFTILITTDPAADCFKELNTEEAYTVTVTEKKAILCGCGAAGAFYAAVTFADLCYFENGMLMVPATRILDYPDFPFRGHFMECRHGSEFLTRQDYYDMIDYLASQKVNRFTIGVYGCWGIQYDDRPMEYLYVPLKDFPEIKTPKVIKYYSVKQQKWIYEDQLLPKMYEEDYLGDLMAYAKKKNIVIKPLFNSLGHNTLIPRMIPEIAAKDSNGKSKDIGFCTKNEKTYEVLFKMYDDIINRYLIPNGLDEIQIGLDEVGDSYICHCEQCEGISHRDLMVEFIIRLCKHLKEQGMKRIHIYHDMLFHHFDTINEALKERFVAEGIYDEVVIDWWSYEDPKDIFYGRTADVNSIFHSIVKPFTGYYHWTIPTDSNENIRACAKLAKERGFEGMETYSSFEYCYDKNYRTLAEVAWNAQECDNMEDFDLRYAHRFYPQETQKALTAFRAMSDIMKDESRQMYMNRICYRFEYYFFCYRRGTKDAIVHQNFPGDAFKRIADEEAVFIPYFDYLKEKARVALDFFENNSNHSQINRIWNLTARHYYTTADEYQTMYGLYKTYQKGITDSYTILKELYRLIAQREMLMELAEEVRIPATAYTYLRNMSMFRQYMIDLRNYFMQELAAGRKPVFNIMDLSYVTDKEFEFIR